MNRNYKPLLATALLLVVIISIILFLNLGDIFNNSLHLSSLIFILISEFITFAAIYESISKKRGVFFNAGLISITFIYFGVTLIFNTLLSFSFGNVINSVTFNVVAILLYFLLLICVQLFAKEKNK